MHVFRIRNLTRWSLLVVACFVITGPVYAQQPGLAADQVPGFVLQSWLDQGVAFAGISHANGCHTMTTGGAGKRVQFLSCPNGFAEKLQGSSRVVGNSICSTFPYPGQPVVEQCREWFRLGDNKFAVRNKGEVTSTQYRLVK